MPVDLTPIANVLLQLAGAAILGLGTWAISRLLQLLGLKTSAQAAANLDDALGKAVTYGLQQSQELIRQKGWDHVDVRNATLAAAAPYLIKRFPDTLKAVGVDFSNEKAVTDTVIGALDRAFPHAAARAAASPATPPATAPSPPTTAELADQPRVTTTLVEGSQA
jgi:hypothetical protein